MKKILFLMMAILVMAGCDNNEEVVQDTPYLKLQTKNIAISHLEYSTEIKVVSNIDFEVEPKEYYYWVDYDNTENTILVKIEGNYSNDKRECLLIAKNETRDISDTLKIAQEGYPAFSGDNNNGGSINGGGSSSTTSRQCAARTKKGTRCKRTASKGSIYCWQHKK